jgi:hypothetical protein
MPVDDTGKVRVGFSVLLTFVCATIALVFFRAADVPSALSIVSGMAGLNGTTLPTPFAALPLANELGAFLGVQIGTVELFDAQLAVMIAFFLFVVWAFPNVYEWLGEYPTALGAGTRDQKPTVRFTSLVAWQPRLATGLFLGMIGAVTLLKSVSGAPTEFIYFQF